MCVERGFRAVGVAGGTGFEDGHMFAQRPERDGRCHLAVELEQPEIGMHAAMAVLHQRISKNADDCRVQAALQVLDLDEIGRRETGLADAVDKGGVSLQELRDLCLVALFGEDPHRRPLQDRAELIGRAGQLQPRPDELDARSRMDCEHAFGLEHAQCIAQRRDRNADDVGKLALRHEGAGLHPPLEQCLEHALIGEVAEALRGNRLFGDGGELYSTGHLQVFPIWHIR